MDEWFCLMYVAPFSVEVVAERTSLGSCRKSSCVVQGLFDLNNHAG